MVSGCVDAQLSRLRIHDNNAYHGAGMGVGGLGADRTRVWIGDDVRIEDNTAFRAGGGLYVYAATVRIGGSDTVVLVAETAVRNQPYGTQAIPPVLCAPTS